MGLKSWFKGLFKHTISVSDIDSNHLIALSMSNAKIKFGKTLEVAPNFVCVLTYKNKVADIFTEGRYRLDTTNMPLLSRLQKLTQPNKKGVLPKTFKVDIYYVNLKVFENAKFYAVDTVNIKDKNYKKVRAHLVGKFSYQISSPVEFLEGMFTEFGVVRDGIAKDEISNWVAELATKRVQKNNVTVENLYTRDNSCFEGLIEYINKNLYDVGVKLSSIEITDVKFPKKLYKRTTLSFDELHQKEQREFIPELTVSPNPVDKAESIDFENQSNQVYLQEAEEIENDVNTKEVTIQSKQIEEELPVEKTIQYKKCSNCGALNSIDSQTCFACGHKF